MQISRFDLIIYNSCHWAASSAYFSPDVIISSRALTCSIVVRLYYYRDPTCCSIGALDGLTIGTYDGTELGSPEGLTEGTTCGNLEGFLLGD